MNLNSANMQTVFSSVFRGIRPGWVLCLVIVLCCNVRLQAQDIIYADGNPNPPFLFPDGTATANGPALNVTISPVKAGAVPPITMTITSLSFEDGIGETIVCNDCAGPQVIDGITFQSTGPTVTITGVPLAAAVGKVIRFTILASVDGDPCQRSYTLNVERRPVDLGLVLDRSGSMSWKYDGSLTADKSLSRWAGLVRGISVLSAQVDALDITGDKIVVRMFASPGVIASPAPFDAGLVPVAGNINQLQPIYGPIEPVGNTALGEGIIAARDQMIPGTANSNKAMIVFSDGVQNTGDRVKTVAPNAFTQTDAGQKLRGNADEIKLYTICLGTTGHNPQLMQDIGGANGGLSLNPNLVTTFESEAQFAAMFTLHLANILKGNSPQFVDIRNGKFPLSSGGEFPPPPIVSDSFSVNKGINIVTVTLFAQNRYEPDVVSVKAGNTELVQYATKTRGDGFITLAFHTPIKGGPAIKLDGEWKVTARLGTNPGITVPYVLMVMVDDHTLRPSYALGDSSFKVNQVVKPAVTLQRRNESITNAQALAVFLKAGDDINDLLARANVDFKVPPTDPGSPDVAKLAKLMEDTAFLNKIKEKDQLVDLLYNNASKSYTGTFNGLDVTGVYQVIYRVTATDSLLGKIQRYHTESFYVRFPDIDVPNSQLAITRQDSFTVITFRPQASNGKLIGAGWGGAFSLEAQNATIHNIVDKGDGSYEILVKGELSGPVKLSVGGEEVIDGKIGSIDCYMPNQNIFKRIQCWLESIGLPAWTIWVILLLLLLLILLLFRKRKK